MCPPVRGLTTLSKLAGSYVQEYSKHIDCKIHFLPSVSVSVLSPKNSTTETMKRLPILGQFLGRLCWNPYVTADGECTFLKNLFGETKYLPSIQRPMNSSTLVRFLVFFCLQLLADGCCSGVCGDCFRSIQAMLWKEKPTSGYGYGLDFLYIC